MGTPSHLTVIRETQCQKQDTHHAKRFVQWTITGTALDANEQKKKCQDGVTEQRSNNLLV